jgi:hypothetical protein
VLRRDELAVVRQQRRVILGHDRFLLRRLLAAYSTYGQFDQRMRLPSRVRYTAIITPIANPRFAPKRGKYLRLTTERGKAFNAL